LFFHFVADGRIVIFFEFVAIEKSPLAGFAGRLKRPVSRGSAAANPVRSAGPGTLS